MWPWIVGGTLLWLFLGYWAAAVAASHDSEKIRSFSKAAAFETTLFGAMAFLALILISPWFDGLTYWRKPMWSWPAWKPKQSNTDKQMP